MVGNGDMRKGNSYRRTGCKEKGKEGDIVSGEEFLRRGLVSLVLFLITGT